MEIHRPRVRAQRLMVLSEVRDLSTLGLVAVLEPPLRALLAPLGSTMVESSPRTRVQLAAMGSKVLGSAAARAPSGTHGPGQTLSETPVSTMGRFSKFIPYSSRRSGSGSVNGLGFESPGFDGPGSGCCMWYPLATPFSCGDSPGFPANLSNSSIRGLSPGLSTYMTTCSLAFCLSVEILFIWRDMTYWAALCF
jgi:hypothetical protein